MTNSRVFEVNRHCSEDSWDAIWKSIWFQRDMWRPSFRSNQDIELLKQVTKALVPLDVFPSVLDCTCGLGSKAIYLAEMGYRVDASDASSEAVRITRQFSQEEGVQIPCFRSRWSELPDRCCRTYDWVFSDAFDLASTREDLLAAAKGIHAVLRKGGRFVFPGAHQWFTQEERHEVLSRDWNELQHIEVSSPLQKDDQTLTAIYVHDKCEDGITVNAILLWEQDSRLHVDIVQDWIRCFRWTWQDFVDILTKAGFSDVRSQKLDEFPARAPYIPNVAVK